MTGRAGDRLVMRLRHSPAQEHSNNCLEATAYPGCACPRITEREPENGEIISCSLQG